MRIQLTVDGGFAPFPGLTRPVALDTAALPEADAAELERLVRAANAFQQPAVTAPPPGSADHRTYTVTVEDGRARNEFQVSDPIGDPAVAALIAAVRAMARRPGDPSPNP